MIVNGKNYGTKSFVVQLRDPKTFDLLPGVAIGDCGAKMGRNGIDNGWLQFTHVRIPRSHLLMRYTQVSRDGDVTEPPMAQLTYGALIQGRVSMIRESADIAKKAATIAIRYSCIRRQFAAGVGLEETKIMDYQTHQQRLLPILAATFAMHFGAMEVYRIYDELLHKLEAAKPGDPSMKSALEALKETHATSAGLKAYSTWYAVEAIETCRQCCGGHGYSAYTGLAAMYQDYVVQCSWEGDNTVLTLQAGRYLIGCARDSRKGKKMPSGVAYLNNKEALLHKKSAKTELSLDDISEAFDVVRCHVVLALGARFEELIARQGITEEAAYDQCSIHRFNAAKIHTIGYLFQRFYDSVKKAPVELKDVLAQLCLLFGLVKIQENAGLFLQYGFLQAQHMEYIENKVLALFGDLRSQVIPLTDSFGLSDFILNSPLGCRDGDVYRRYFEQVVAMNPPKKPEYFETLLKPLLEGYFPTSDRLELSQDN